MVDYLETGLSIIVDQGDPVRMIEPQLVPEKHGNLDNLFRWDSHVNSGSADDCRVLDVGWKVLFQGLDETVLSLL